MQTALDTNRLQQLATEINVLQRQTARQLLELGEAQCGKDASIKRMAEIVGRQVGLKPHIAAELMLRFGRGS